jgi:flagellar hook protein FlgE
MFSGLAGLSNNQTGLDVVGNNIANVNTIGYKGSKIEFTELLNQTIRGASSPQTDGRGGTNPIQVGLGVGTSAISVSHQQGNLLSTGLMSDLALQGNGFFILGDGSQTFFSRAGSFNFDANGYLVHSSGMKAYGWMADASGAIDALRTIEPLSIPVGQTVKANETKNITYAYNLDARAYTEGTAILASGNSANIDTVTGIFARTDTIDNVIGTHTIDVFAETHNGENINLNGTNKLSDLGITNINSFRIVVDGKESTVSLITSSPTVNELISAINAQVTGVTALLYGGQIQLTRDVAGLGATTYVYDANQIDTDSLQKLTSVSSHGGAGTAVTETESIDIMAYLKATIPGHAASVVGGHQKHGYVDAFGTVVADATEIAALDLSAITTGGVTVDFSDLASSAKTLLTEARNNHVTSTNGIAGICFGEGLEWLPASKTIGNKSGLQLTDTLSGIVDTKDIVVTANGTDPVTFDVSAAIVTPIHAATAADVAAALAETPSRVIALGSAVPAVYLSASSKISDLITCFNSWSKATIGANLDKFYMGLTKAGNLFVTYENGASKNPITVEDSDPLTTTGIIDTFFAADGNWDDEADSAVTFNKTSTVAHIDHTFVQAVTGTVLSLPLSFTSSDAFISGIGGVTISPTAAGFQTGRVVVQTVAPTTHQASSTVYDSLGKEHNVTLNLTRTGPNQWAWTATGIGEAISGGGSFVFDNQGVFTNVDALQKITIGAQGSGANELSITPDFSGVSQYADTSTMVHSSQDGYPNGSLSTYSISSDGTIIGIYSNGLNQNIGQLGVATFNNPTGLLKGSDGMFISSNNSGDAQVGVASTNGRGSISAGTLEMSNVDIAKEFANMIIYQRGFQANSKIITTGDEILQTLVNMKR